jgi:hypothetical protein
MRNVTGGLFRPVDSLVATPNRALGIGRAIAIFFRPRRDRGRLLDQANLPDRMKHDIGLPLGLFGSADRHWADYR